MIPYVDFLKKISSRYLICRPMASWWKTAPVTDEKIIAAAKCWNKVGKATAGYGVKVLLCPDWIGAANSAHAISLLMENTDPEYVSLLFDSGHFAYCGVDPVTMVSRYVKRIKHVHLKDIRPEVVERVKKENLSFLQGVREGAFTVPGDGCVDFDSIFKVLSENNYEGYMLVEAEQDPSKANPLEYALKARKYIKEHTGL